MGHQCRASGINYREKQCREVPAAEGQHDRHHILRTRA